MIACIFFESSSFPSLETIKPKIIPKNTINAHFSRFILMPYSLHFWKHNLSFCKWLSMSLTIHRKGIQKCFHKIVQILSECFSHCSSICWRAILNSKRHHLPYKSAPICNKCNLVSVLWDHRYLMISWISI